MLLIENKRIWVSKANNQAIEKAQGRNILLLNPDTVVEESTFKKVVDFMDENPDAEDLALNGRWKGNFCPNQNEDYPLKVAFFKIFGLSRLFPKSKLFGSYHLGYLNEHEVNKVDVLVEPFSCLKEVSEKIGMLDELFSCTERILIFHTESPKGDITITIIQRPLLSITKVRAQKELSKLCLYLL